MTAGQEGRDLRGGGSLGSGELEADVRRVEQVRSADPRRTGGRNCRVVARRLPRFRVLGRIVLGRIILGRITFGRINDAG
jgi:hypothetical protein